MLYALIFLIVCFLITIEGDAEHPVNKAALWIMFSPFYLLEWLFYKLKRVKK